MLPIAVGGPQLGMSLQKPITEFAWHSRKRGLKLRTVDTRTYRSRSCPDLIDHL